MATEKLEIRDFIEMLQKGTDYLSAESKNINALNVFPVPDGDTGTNMSLTAKSGIQQLKEAEVSTVGQASVQFSKGLLMGARGNSGVILSQLFRGFAQTLEPHQALNASLFAKALENGVDTAYKAVMKPVEGTILTVSKDAAKGAKKAAKSNKDLIYVLNKTVEAAEASLKRTPDLLPVLKEVGVVDSGGQGLLMIYRGFLAKLTGEEIVKETPDIVNDDWVHETVHETMSPEAISYGFCTEFMTRLKETVDEPALRQRLAEYGDSLLVVADDELLKVHIHTEKPGDLLSIGQEYGELIKIKIDNMREQNRSLQGKKEANKSDQVRDAFGIATVGMGEGVEKLFKSLGATVVIKGGQTMNPSTEDLLEAIDEVAAETVYILPNNTNIIMAARQAADVSGVRVEVLQTKSIPQGLAALMSFDPNASVEDNVEIMTEAKDTVKSGQITYAVRDTVVDGITIKKDDYIGLYDGNIEISAEDNQTALKKLIGRMVEKDDEIVTLIYGDSIEASVAESTYKELEEAYPDLEFELHDGNQPLYDYLITIE